MNELGRKAPGESRRRGAALLATLVLAIAVGGMCAALLVLNLSTQRKREQVRGLESAFYAAEAGLSDAFMQVTEGQLVPTDTSLWVGTANDPHTLGPASYWVEVAPQQPRGYSLASTGVDGRSQQRLELVLREAATGFFQYAAFGANGVVLDSNAFIDSYDSALGPYDAQVQGGNAFARENGNVGSNDDILLRANTEVHGDVRPGPVHTVDDSAPNTYVSGSTNPLEKAVDFPPISVPAIPSSGPLVGTGDVVLGPGPIHHDSILMKGGSRLTIRGPATVVVDDFTMKSNSNLVLDPADGPIEFYGTGDFVLESNSGVTTLSDSALDVTLLLSGNNVSASPRDRLELGANSEFIGAIYAPDAEFKLASNFTVFGSVMCGRLHLSSFGEIHFDEALLYDGYGATGEFESVLWRRLPLQ